MKKTLAFITALSILLCLSGCTNSGSENANKSQNVYNEINALYESVEKYCEFVLLAWSDGFKSDDAADSCFFIWDGKFSENKEGIDMELISKYTGKSADEVRQFVLDKFGTTSYRAANLLQSSLFKLSLYKSDMPGYVDYNLGIVDFFCDGLNIYTDLDNKYVTAEQNLRSLPEGNEEFIAKASQVLRDIKKVREICEEITEFCRDAKRTSEAKKANYNSKSKELKEYLTKMEDTLYTLSFQAK